MKLIREQGVNRQGIKIGSNCWVRLGFLDGLPGLRFVILRCFYEYLIDIKVIESQVENN